MIPELIEPLAVTVSYLYIGGIISYLFKWNFGFIEKCDGYGPGSHIVVSIVWPVALIMVAIDRIAWLIAKTLS